MTIAEDFAAMISHHLEARRLLRSQKEKDMPFGDKLGDKMG